MTGADIERALPPCARCGHPIHGGYTLSSFGAVHPGCAPQPRVYEPWNGKSSFTVWHYVGIVVLVFFGGCGMICIQIVDSRKASTATKETTPAPTPAFTRTYRYTSTPAPPPPPPPRPATPPRAGGTRAMCCDGTVSPSCACGGGRGCCSRHGGVCGCD